MYRLRLVILGDISRYVSQSCALSSFVYESNLGDQVWFMANMAELNERLDRLQGSERQAPYRRTPAPFPHGNGAGPFIRNHHHQTAWRLRARLRGVWCVR